MMRPSLPSLLVYAVLIVAALYGLFSLADSSPDGSATMAPDLHFGQ